MAETEARGPVIHPIQVGGLSTNSTDATTTPSHSTPATSLLLPTRRASRSSLSHGAHGEQAWRTSTENMERTTEHMENMETYGEHGERNGAHGVRVWRTWSTSRSALRRTWRAYVGHTLVDLASFPDAFARGLCLFAPAAAAARRRGAHRAHQWAHGERHGERGVRAWRKWSTSMERMEHATEHLDNMEYDNG